jgi:hypothetical protein
LPSLINQIGEFVLRGGKISARREAGEGKVSGASVGKAAVSASWFLRRDGTGLFRGRCRQRAMKSDWTIAFKGGPEYVTGQFGNGSRRFRYTLATISLSTM